MSSSEKRVRYQKGVNLELDEKFQEYKKKRLFQGYSYMYALSQKEVDLMIKLWKRERTKPNRLSFNDVSKLVEFTARIEECRNCQKREKTRQRVERSREKRAVTKKNKDTKVARASRKPLKTRSARKRKRTGVKAEAPANFRRKRGKKAVTKKNKDTKVTRASRKPRKTRSVRNRKGTGVKADAPANFRIKRLVKERKGSREKISVGKMKLS